MPKTRQQKKEIVLKIVNKLQKAKSLVFVDFAGLKTSEADELRSKCKPDGEYLVVKKTLFDVAVKEAADRGFTIQGVEAEKLQGEMAVMFDYADEIASMRLAEGFGKIHKALQVRGGIYEQKFIDIAHVLAMAKLPGKAELLARMAGSLRAPLAGLVSVLQGNLRGLAQVLKARSEKI